MNSLTREDVVDNNISVLSVSSKMDGKDVGKHAIAAKVHFSERELMFTFARCRRLSVCRL